MDRGLGVKDVVTKKKSTHDVEPFLQAIRRATSGIGRTGSVGMISGAFTTTLLTIQRSRVD